MRFTTQVKSISYLKANAAEMLEKLAEQREPVLITQNGEARAVLQDVASYDEMQETLALLKLLALGQQDIDAGRYEPVDVAFDRVLAGKRAVGQPAGAADAAPATPEPVRAARSAKLAPKSPPRPRLKSAARTTL